MINNEIKGLLDKYHNKYHEKLDKMQEHLDYLDIQGQENRSRSVKADPIRNLITKNFNMIERASSSPVKLESKAVGDMLLTTHLTGDQPRDYSFDTIMQKGYNVHVSDLVPNFQISGGTYSYPVELATGEGSPDWQTEGSDKAQVDYDLEIKDCSTEFLAAYATYSKKMKNNLPFLERFLPQALRRDYFKAEDDKFMTIIAAGVTASSEVAASHDTYAEQLMKEISTLEEAGHVPNFIVVKAADWYKILTEEKSSGAGYGLPGAVYFQNGQIFVNGVLLVKAQWLPSNKYLIGNFNGMKKIVTEGLSLEFSEAAGFRSNTIDVRIESQCNICIENPSSVVYGDFTAAA